MRAVGVVDDARELRIDEQHRGEVFVRGLTCLRLEPRRQAQLRALGRDALAGVRHRHVTDVVAQHREAHGGAQAISHARLKRRARGDGVEQPRGDVHRAQTVRVARVRRAGEREIAEAQLPHVTQTLKRSAVDDARLFG